jgi:hypothetical protein
MDYMFAKFIWFLAMAFILGAAIGWFMCSGNED